jgi:hypothetical protein
MPEGMPSGCSLRSGNLLEEASLHQPPPMTTPLKPSNRSLSVALASALSMAGFGAQALVLTTVPQVFLFGPADDNFTQSASLATFNQAGALLSVHIELSGLAEFVLTAKADHNEGTVLEMTEQSFFSLTGLPSALLTTSSPVYSVGPFGLVANESRSFIGTVTAPMASVDLTALFDLNAYDLSAGAPASLPLLFTSMSEFTFAKSGSDLSAGSAIIGQGSVSVSYTYETVQPPPAVPEVTTALSAGGFALMGAFFLFRNRKTPSGKISAPTVD